MSERLHAEPEAAELLVGEDALLCRKPLLLGRLVELGGYVAVDEVLLEAPTEGRPDELVDVVAHGRAPLCDPAADRVQLGRSHLVSDDRAQRSLLDLARQDPRVLTLTLRGLPALSCLDEQQMSALTVGL
jgi:hypothetical protein